MPGPLLFAVAKILGPSIFLLIPIPINNERSLRKLRVTDGKTLTCTSAFSTVRNL